MNHTALRPMGADRLYTTTEGCSKQETIGRREVKRIYDGKEWKTWSDQATYFGQFGLVLDTFAS